LDCPIIQEKLNPITMKKPLRFFSFVFFLFAIYLNVFYKEDSFLARIASGKANVSKEQVAEMKQPKLSETTVAEVK
jgi:predicted membrane protein